MSGSKDDDRLWYNSNFMLLNDRAGSTKIGLDMIFQNDQIDHCHVESLCPGYLAVLLDGEIPNRHCGSFNNGLDVSVYPYDLGNLGILPYLGTNVLY